MTKYKQIYCYKWVFRAYISISYSYFWVLIDNCFRIDDIKSMMVFRKPTGIKGFVEVFMSLR
jgi:hypothetical protein